MDTLTGILIIAGLTLLIIGIRFVVTRVVDKGTDVIHNAITENKNRNKPNTPTSLADRYRDSDIYTHQASSQATPQQSINPQSNQHQQDVLVTVKPQTDDNGYVARSTGNSAAKRYCGKCGKQLEHEEKFCASCGQKRAG